MGAQYKGHGRNPFPLASQPLFWGSKERYTELGDPGGSQRIAQVLLPRKCSFLSDLPKIMSLAHDTTGDTPSRVPSSLVFPDLLYLWPCTCCWLFQNTLLCLCGSCLFFKVSVQSPLFSGELSLTLLQVSTEARTGLSSQLTLLPLPCEHFTPSSLPS